MKPIDAVLDSLFPPPRLFVSGCLLSLSLFSPTTQAGNETVYQEVDDRVVCIRSIASDKSVLTGTGFFISPNVVATVAHQVEGAESVIVHLTDGKKSEAKYLLSKPDWDVALIQVPKTALKGLPVEITLPKLGDDVFTIGCPMDLDHSLSRGVVSNPKRQLEGKELIQSDLAVNSGNSGGPLFDKQGRVIGLIMGSYKGGTGLNFAVPAKYLFSTIQEAGLVGSGSAAPQAGPTMGASGAAPPLAQLVAQLAAHPDSPELNSQVATAYFEQNHLDKAKHHFQKALDAWPEHHQILTNMGYVLHKLGEHEKAKEVLIKAISIDPNFPIAYLNLGMVYANGLNNNGSARKAFTKFIELDPNNPKVRDVQKWMESH